MKPDKKLPSLDELLERNSDPPFLRGSHQKSPAVKAQSAQIVKGPVVKASKYDPIDQYDYFASTQDAILDHWNAPQDLPDVEAPNDRQKLTKIHDTRRKAVLGLKGPRGGPQKRLKSSEN